MRYSMNICASYLLRHSGNLNRSHPEGATERSPPDIFATLHLVSESIILTINIVFYSLASIAYIHIYMYH